MPSRSRATLLVVALVVVACAGDRPRPQPVATVATTSAVTTTTTTATTTTSTSPTAAPTSSASITVPPCFAADPDDFGYDGATDTITLCAKSTCLALQRDHDPSVASPPAASLAGAGPNLHQGVEPPADPQVAVTSTMVKLSATRWASVPYAKSKQARLLWASKDGKRALVVRYVGELGALNREHFDLVDLAKHVSLAHAELCNYVIETEAWVDDAESIAELEDFHDNPIILAALVDLAHPRFVTVGVKSIEGYPGCPGPDDMGTKFTLRQNLGIFDVTRRRVGRALVDFDGKIVARLDGDFPNGPTPPTGREDALLRIDDDRRVLVRYSANPSDAICAGVMRIVAATSADGPPLEPPRCVPYCKKLAPLFPP